MDPVLNFGTGDHTLIDSILVIWPGDQYQVLRTVKADQAIKISLKDAAGTWDYAANAPAVKRLLTISPAPVPLHTENAYNDFDQQPLLLNYLSRRGPCLAKGDVDGNGTEDVFFGGAQGHAAQLFLQTADGILVDKLQPAI